MCVLLITRLLRGVGRWARKPVNHTSWEAVVTPTDRPKSVRNCCLIELFVALFVLSLCPFDISVGVGAFVIGLGQISSFLSCCCLKLVHTYLNRRNFVKYYSTVPLSLCTCYILRTIRLGFTEMLETGASETSKWKYMYAAGFDPAMFRTKG